MARLPLVTEAQVSPDLASVHQKVASTESSMATTYQAILEQHLVGGELLEAQLMSVMPRNRGTDTRSIFLIWAEARN